MQILLTLVIFLLGIYIPYWVGCITDKEPVAMHTWLNGAMVILLGAMGGSCMYVIWYWLGLVLPK